MDLLGVPQLVRNAVRFRHVIAVTATLFMGSASLCRNHIRPTLFGFYVPGSVGHFRAF